MISAESEYVPFSESVFAQGPVEHWLTNIEKMMRKTLYDKTKFALNSYPEDQLKRDKWFFDYPAMSVLTID